MNRFDLPFYTMSGIVESDIWGLPVFTAFFLQKDFIGVIPKGTPIFQIIPFKRDDWEREVSDDDDDLDNDLDNDEDGDGDGDEEDHDEFGFSGLSDGIDADDLK